MLKRIAQGSLPFVLAAALGACATGDMGMEWVEIAEGDSNLVFYGTGLDGGYRKFLTGKTPQYDTMSVGVYGPRSGGFPRAVLHLYEAAPQRHFPTAPALSKYVAETEFFKGKRIIANPEGKTRNAAGNIRYMTFMADALPCVAFMQFMGHQDEGGLGDKRLDGYYCRNEADSIAAGEAVEIVKAIGHRDHGVPKPPPEWGE